VLGLTITEARPEVEAEGLFLKVVDHRFDAAAPEGTILFQEPPAGQIVKIGRPLHVTVSLGRKRSRVPELQGLPLGEGAVLLGSAGFAVGRRTAIIDERLPAGAIVASEPAAGEELKEGLAVDLLISRGPDRRSAMPSLLGAALPEALALMRGREFGLEDLHTELRPGLPHNTVVRQEPLPGSLVAPQEKVSLWISRSPFDASFEPTERFELVSYSVPPALDSARLTILTRWQGQEKILLEGRYPGGEEVKIPVAARHGMEVHIQINDRTVWKKTL
jgi:eukaryotic-like serine/threonine-protein kinase